MNKRAIRKWESDEEWIRERYGNERAENKIIKAENINERAENKIIKAENINQRAEDKIIKAENINERAEYNMSRRVGEGNKWVKKARATTFTI